MTASPRCASTWRKISRRPPRTARFRASGNPLVEQLRAAKAALRPHRIIGNDADALPAAAPIDRFGIAAGRRIEHQQIGRASWRDRLCSYVVFSVVAVSLQKKTHPI